MKKIQFASMIVVSAFLVFLIFGCQNKEAERLSQKKLELRSSIDEIVEAIDKKLVALNNARSTGQEAKIFEIDQIMQKLQSMRSDLVAESTKAEQIKSNEWDKFEKNVNDEITKVKSTLEDADLAMSEVPPESLPNPSF